MEAAAKSNNTATIEKPETTEEKPTAPPVPTYTPDKQAAPPKTDNGGPRKLIVGGVVAAVVIGGGIWGTNAYLWGRDHVETDDAFVTGNLVNVSPKIGGRLESMDLSEGDVVKRGQLLAKLDDSTQQAQLAAAQTALESARTQIPQAESNLKFQQESTAAGINKAQSGGDTQLARVRAAQEQLRLASRTTENQVAQAGAQVRAAQANGLAGGSAGTNGGGNPCWTETGGSDSATSGCRAVGESIVRAGRRGQSDP